MNDALRKNVEAVLAEEDGIPLDEIDARLEELQKELLKVANAKGNYDSIANEIYRLREAKQNAQVDNAEREGMKQRNVAVSGRADAGYHGIRLAVGSRAD